MAIKTGIVTSTLTLLASTTLQAGHFAAPATAITFTFEATDVGNRVAGEHTLISTAFDTDTNRFSWSSTLTRNAENNRLADGGWLVISEGPDPRAQTKEYAIFYLDSQSNKVSAYDYSSIHRSHSWGSTAFLGETTLNTVEKGNQRTFSFDFDMTSINSRTDLGPDWKGTTFADEVGIWFHSLDGLRTGYHEDGSLAKFSYQAEGRYDANYRPTSSPFNNDSAPKEIPESSVVSALGILAALTFKQRFPSAQAAKRS